MSFPDEDIVGGSSSSVDNQPLGDGKPATTGFRAESVEVLAGKKMVQHRLNFYSGEGHKSQDGGLEADTGKRLGNGNGRMPKRESIERLASSRLVGTMRDTFQDDTPPVGAGKNTSETVESSSTRESLDKVSGPALCAYLCLHVAQTSCSPVTVRSLEWTSFRNDL